ncbi:hypothetical protein QQP08_027351 [Theobroma cacao]|nr:hypothetical protein QQP08_027351 [Theobroma cacao]
MRQLGFVDITLEGESPIRSTSSLATSETAQVTYLEISSLVGANSVLWIQRLNGSFLVKVKFRFKCLKGQLGKHIVLEAPPVLLNLLTGQGYGYPKNFLMRLRGERSLPSGNGFFIRDLSAEMHATKRQSNLKKEYKEAQLHCFC